MSKLWGGTECSIINEVTTEGKDYEASKGCWVALLMSVYNFKYNTICYAINKLKTLICW